MNNITITYVKLGINPIVKNWGYLERWKSTANLIK